jgi:hypothetical protein
MVTPIDKKVQQPGDITAIQDAYTGPARQLTVDTQRNELRLHDGRRKGGWRLPNLEQLKRLFMSVDHDLGQVKFASDLRGFMARTAKGTYRLRTLKGEGGVLVDNGNGAADPVIRLSGRLSAKVESQIADYNQALESGNYVANPTADNKPAGLGAQSGALTVFAGVTETDVEVIIQRVISMTDATNTIYTRRRTAGTWSSWS